MTNQVAGVVSIGAELFEALQIAPKTWGGRMKSYWILISIIYNCMHKTCLVMQNMWRKQ